MSNNYIGVVDDGESISGSHLYRVNYGDFSILIESPTELSITECKEKADLILENKDARIEPIAIEDRNQAEIEQFRREYLDCTATLCSLAGEQYTGKLTNVDYKRVVLTSASNPLTGILTGFMVYYRTVLREIDGPNWYENITGL